MSMGDDGGFSLVELMVVLLILAVLIVIGLTSYGRMTQNAESTGAHLDLLTATKVQALQHLQKGEFTTDVDVLFDLEPNLRYSSDGEPAGTVVVRFEADRSEIDVCLFTQTSNGSWFSIRHSLEVGDSFGLSAPVACTEGNVGSWPTDPW